MHERKIDLWPACAASLALGGCESLKESPDRSVDPATDLKALETYHQPKTISDYNSMPDSSAKTARRNEVVNGRIAAIDIHFNMFTQTLAQQGVLTNVGTDAAVLGLSAAGAIVGGATLKADVAAEAALKIKAGVITSEVADGGDDWILVTVRIVIGQM